METSITNLLPIDGWSNTEQLYTFRRYTFDIFHSLVSLQYSEFQRLATLYKNKSVGLPDYDEEFCYKIYDIICAFSLCNYPHEANYYLDQPTTFLFETLLLTMNPLRFYILDLVIERGKLSKVTYYMYYNCVQRSCKDIPKLLSYLIPKDKDKEYIDLVHYQCIKNCLKNQTMDNQTTDIDFDKNYCILLTFFRNGYTLNRHSELTRLTKQRLINDGIHPYQLNIFTTFKRRKLKMKHTLKILKLIIICDIIEYVICSYIVHDRYVDTPLSRRQIRRMKKMNKYMAIH